MTVTELWDCDCHGAVAQWLSWSCGTVTVKELCGTVKELRDCG